MLNQKYVYFFPMGDKIVFSFETLETLEARMVKDSESDKATLQRLIAADRTGNFVTLEDGEVILQQN